MSGYPGNVARTKANKQRTLEKSLQKQHLQQQQQPNVYSFPQPIAKPIAQQAVISNEQAVIANPYQTHNHHPSFIPHAVPQNKYQPANQQCFVQQNQQQLYVNNPYTQNNPAIYQQTAHRVVVQPTNPQMMHHQQQQVHYSTNYQQQPRVIIRQQQQPPQPMFANQPPSQYQTIKD